MEAEALSTQDLITQPDLAERTADDTAGRDATPVADLEVADLQVVDVDVDLAADELEPKQFADFGVAEPICAALAAAGITTAFPIQALTLPIALDRHDVIGQARTGTGKTLAFGVPVLQHVLETERHGKAAPRALIVVPTRELAIQVADDLRIASTGSDVNVVTLYGGRAYEPQIEALATVDIVVGTPGRLLDLSRQKELDLSAVDALVLDEADRMLDLGFLPDVEAILRLTPQHRQTMLFSATMPAEIVTLARRHLRRPTHIRAEHHDEHAFVPTTQQHVFRTHHLDKIEVLARVLQVEGRGLTIVFSRTRRACDTITTQLTERGFAAAAVHGDLGQGQRERSLRAFRSGKVDVLVATDVAARGLDVDDVTHVINLECPEDEKAYLHRIGRTGRAGRAGVAVTFVDWSDLARWKVISETLNLGHPEPTETYSTSEHLFSALNISPTAKGVLPRAQRERAGLEAEDLEDIGETGHSRAKRVSHGPGDRARTSQPSRSDGSDQSERSPRPPRRRTRGGVAGGPAGQARPGTDGAAQATPGNSLDQQSEAPAQRRRRSRGGRAASAHPRAAGQDSTRPATQAELRDIAAG